MSFTVSKRLGGLAAVLLLLILPVPGHAVQFVYVDQAGVCDGNTPCFTTIQDGVNHATATMDNSGLVFIFPGTYPESVDLSKMGSAVGGSPGSIDLLDTAIIPAITSTVSPLMSPQTLAPGVIPLDALNGVAAAVLRFEDMMNAAASHLKSSSGAALSGSTAAAAPPPMLVDVMPASGPAIYNSVVPFPGDVGIVGFNVQSPDDDGIRVNATGFVSLDFILSNGNGKSGIVAQGDGMFVQFVDTDDNKAGGLEATSMEDFTALNAAADRNGAGANGIGISAHDEVQVIGIPFGETDSDLAALFRTTTANGNGRAGISIDSGDNAFVAFERIVIGTEGLFANGNSGNGIEIESGGDSTVAVAVADGNKAGGMSIFSNGAVEIVSCDASGNDVDGFNVSALGKTEFGSFQSLGALFLRVRADENKRNGIVATAMAGIVLINDSTASHNKSIGIALPSLVLNSSLVQGNIICGNDVGLRLGSTVTLDATANWWGSTTGPFHMTKNPNGQGNPVIDGTSGGGGGNVTFIPFIDTVTASASGAFSVGAATTIRFQFSGGNGSVFLGPLPDPIFAFALAIFESPVPGPFTLTTDNGILTDQEGYLSGPTIQQYINESPGIVAVRLIAAHTASATVSEETPCDLADSITVRIGFLEAPVLSAAALALLAGGLAWLGIVMTRRRRRSGHG